MTYEGIVLMLDSLIIKNYDGVHIMDYVATSKLLKKYFALKKSNSTAHNSHCTPLKCDECGTVMEAIYSCPNSKCIQSPNY